MDRRGSNNHQHDAFVRHQEGEGETDFMQTFIRHHMVSILNPVRENIRELQGQVATMKSNLASADARACSNKGKVDQQEQDLIQLKNMTAKMSVILVETRTELAGANDDRAKLLADHDDTKKALNETIDRQSTMSCTVKELSAKASELEGQCRSLSLGLYKADKNLVSTGENLLRLKEAHQELHDDHNGTEKNLQNLTRYSEETARSLQMLSRTCEHHKEDRMEGFKRMDDRLNHLEKMYLATNRDLQQQVDNLKSTNSDIQQLRVALEHENGRSVKFEQMTRTQAESMETLLEHTKHLTRLDTATDRLSTAFSTEKQHMTTTMSEVKGRLDNNGSDIQALGRLAEWQGNELKRQAQCQEDNNLKMKDMIAQGDASEAEVRGLLDWQKDADQTLEMHSLDHQKEHESLGNQGRRLQDAQDALKALQQDMDKMQEAVSNLGKRHDKSMQGLSKGFQETFKHVSGSGGGAWPQRAEGALPAIASKTPRPGSRQGAKTPRGAAPGGGPALGA